MPTLWRGCRSAQRLTRCRIFPERVWMMKRSRITVFAVLVAVLGLVTPNPAEAQRSLSTILEEDRACSLLCADTIADRYEREGYAVVENPNVWMQVQGAEDFEESCQQCNTMERCLGVAEAQRCYSNGGSVGPPPDQPTGYLSGGLAQTSGTSSTTTAISLELAVPISACLSLTGSVGTESVLIPEGSPGPSGEPLASFSSTHLGALPFGADHGGLRAGDQTRLGWLGLGAKLFVYRGIFLAAGVESYESLESSTELGDRAVRLGVGFQRTFSARWLVRGDLNYRFFDELDLDGPGLSVGIGYRFGKKPKKSHQLQEGVQ